MRLVHSASSRWLGLLGFVVGLGLAHGAAAHGPTIEITHAAMKPALLNLYVGSTVHFKNQQAMPGGHTVVDATGAIESPPLEKAGDGWHYTFEEVGRYEVYVSQHPSAKATIVVVPKKK